ncbi:MAG: beta strand repeat-containing protein [Candidatus Binataceae bacterium]
MIAGPSAREGVRSDAGANPLGWFLLKNIVHAALSVLLLTLAACGSGAESTSTPSPTSVLQSITVTDVNPTIATGTSIQLLATGNFSDGTTADLTNSAHWISGSPSVAAVSNAPGTKGVVTGAQAGPSTVGALMSNVAGSTTVTVTPATLTSITVTPPDPSIPKGISLQLTATGNFSDGTTQDLTSTASWTSSMPGIATVGNTAGIQGLVTGSAQGSTAIAATQGGISGSTTVSITPAKLVSMTVIPPDASLAKGTVAQFTANGNFSDETTRDLTNSVNWSSTDQGVVTISNAAGTNGQATGVGVGTATVTATQNGVSGTAAVTGIPATLVSITVTPPSFSIANGTTQQLTAIGNFSDGTTADLTNTVGWISSSSAVAIVSSAHGSHGLVTATGVGSATITARRHGVSGSAGVTVTPATLASITITPPDPSLAKGNSLQLSATGNYTDGSTQNLTNSVGWTSSATTVAVVSNASDTEGLVTAIAVGSATITATFAGVSGSNALTVTAAMLSSIVITPPGPSIAKGTTLPLTATGNFSDGGTANLTSVVSWSSSAPGVAVVGNARRAGGVVFAKGTGTANITATTQGLSALATVTVTAPTLNSIVISPSEPSIANGTSTQLTATGVFSDRTTQDLTTTVSWTSTAPSIAVVSSASGSQGVLIGTGVGTATVTAKQAGVSGSATATITSALLSSITIAPPNPSVAKGTTGQLIATGNFTDGTTEDVTASASWTSSAPSTVVVSNTAGSQGLATAVGLGGATVSATQAGIAGSTAVTVTPAVLTSITITPPNPSLAKGTSIPLTATGAFSDGTTEDLTASVGWVSSDPSVAIVNNAVRSQGVLIGIGTGTVTITATLNQVSGSTTATVTHATLTSITITPPNPSIPKGVSLQLSATGNLSDQTTVDLSTFVSWSSSDPAAVAVSNSAGSKGVVTALQVANATITAALNGISGSTTVSVSAPVPTSMTITPPDSSIAKGTTIQLTATTIFSDGSTQDATPFASWTSSTPANATVDNSPLTAGLVTGVGVGASTITATSNGLSASTTVTVTPATLNSITITPPNPSLAKGTSEQLAALGFYSDGTSQDLTTVVSWTSSDGNVAVVSNAIGSQGLLFGTGTGTASITATLSGNSGSTIVIVTAPSLSSIAISPSNPSLAQGTTQQLAATGNFSDGTSQDLTSSASWTSSADNVASVSNTPGSHGLVTGLNAGTANITATQNGVSGSTGVTVTAATLIRIAIRPLNPTIVKGTTLQLTATGTFANGAPQDLTTLVSWTSSNPSVSVSNALGSEGLVTGLTAGSSIITAFLSGVRGISIVFVTQPIVQSGKVLSGSIPVVGSDVTLWQVGATGYGSTPTPIAESTTDASGIFGFGAFGCTPANAQVYAVASGGDAGGGSNPAIVMMAALGPCNSVPPSFTIDEVTTVASTYALAQFINKTVSAQIPSVGSSASNAAGLANAAALATTNLADVTTGTAAAFLSTGANTPKNLNSLANVLAACVESTGQTCSQCEELFEATTISGFATPSDTMQAVLNEALRPANNVSALFLIQPLRPAPYTPALTSPPPDWAMALNYTGGGLSGPQRIAIDGSGNGWISNNTGNSVTELSPIGGALSPPGGFQASGIVAPGGIAVDAPGNVWIAGQTSNVLTELNSQGAVVFASTASAGGLNKPTGVAIDQSGNVWVPNSASSGAGANSVSKFTSAGAALSPSNGFTGGGLNFPNDVAIDSGGNAWTANFFTNGNISKFSPSASPSGPFTVPGGGANYSIEVDGSSDVWTGLRDPTRLSKFNSSGAALSPFGGLTAGAQSGTTVSGIAIDSAGNVWAANFSGPSANGVTEVDPTGTIAFTGANGLQELTAQPIGLAIDASGNLWVSNTSAPVANSVTEYVGVAAPVQAPRIGEPSLP